MNSPELEDNSIQLCKSANALILRQFEAFKPVCKYLTQALITLSNCRIFAAGNKTLRSKQ